MPYAHFDDRYDDNLKLKRAWKRSPAVVGLHAMAITYCSRHNTDGTLPVDWIDEKLTLLPVKPRERTRILEVALELNLLERVDEETYRVHDFLEWNRSRAQRQALAEQGRRGGLAKAARSSHTGSARSSHGFSHGQSKGSSHPSEGGSSTPRHATPTPRENNNAELRSAVTECFAYWQERCNHPQAALSPDRRGKLEARLRERARLGGGIPRAIQDVRQAIDGAAAAPFIDEKGKRFDDIELVCRNGSKLEDFMGRANQNVVQLDRSSSHLPEGQRPTDEWMRQLEEHLEQQERA